MHSIWLLPEHELLSRLSSLNNGFAEQWGGPIFEPHITLLGDIGGDPRHARALCTDILRAKSNPIARIHGADGADNFFMSLFLDVALPRNIENAREKLALSLDIKAKTFCPHISLAYGPIDNLEKRNSISQLSNELSGLTFEIASIAVVNASQAIPVNAWRPVWRQKIAIP